MTNFLFSNEINLVKWHSSEVVILPATKMKRNKGNEILLTNAYFHCGKILKHKTFCASFLQKEVSIHYFSLYIDFIGQLYGGSRVHSSVCLSDGKVSRFKFPLLYTSSISLNIRLNLQASP